MNKPVLLLLLFYIISVSAIQILNNVSIQESLLPLLGSAIVSEQDGNFFYQTEEAQFVKISLDLVLVEGAFFNNATFGSTDVSSTFFNESVGVLLITELYFSINTFISSVLLFSPAKMHPAQTAVTFDWNGLYLQQIWALPNSLDTTVLGVATTTYFTTASEGYLVQFDVLSGAVVNNIQLNCEEYDEFGVEVIPDPSNPTLPGIVIFLCQQGTTISIFNLSTWEQKQIPIGQSQVFTILTSDTIGLLSFPYPSSTLGITAYNLVTEEIVATAEVSIAVAGLTPIEVDPYGDLDGNMYIVSIYENRTQNLNVGSSVSLVIYDEETQQFSFDGMIYLAKYFPNDNYIILNETFYFWEVYDGSYFELIQYGK